MPQGNAAVVDDEYGLEKAPAGSGVTDQEYGLEPADKNETSHETGTENEKPGFVKRLGQSLGLPTSKEELKQPKQSVGQTIVSHLPISSVYDWGKRAAKNISEGIGEEGEALSNIRAGQPILPNIGKAAYGIVHGGVGSIPFIGQPIETAGQDVANENYAGAAGGLTGVAGQVLAPELVRKGGAVREALPSNGDIALKLRNQETGALKPGVEALSRLAGAGLGHLSTYVGFPTVGELGGYAIGPRIAESIIPDLPHDIPTKVSPGAPLPSYEDFAEERAKDLERRGKEQAKIDVANEKRLTAVEEARQKELADQEKLKLQEAESRQRRGTEQERLDREAARKAALNPLAGLMTTAAPVGSAVIPPIGEAPAAGSISFSSPTKVEIPGYTTAPAEPVAKATPAKIISPTEGEAVRTGNEGRPATWTNEFILQEAAKGNRTAISQAILRGLELPPNARYVMGDPDISRAVLNPREVTRFTPEGEPIRNKENPFTQEPTARIPTIARTPRGTIPNIGEAPPRGGTLPFPGPMPETPAAPIAARPPEPIPEAPAEPVAAAPAPMQIKPLENVKPIMEVPTEPEPEEVKVKGITAEEPKAKGGKRAKAEPIEKRFSQQAILDAEGLLASEAGASLAGEKPGRYYDESEAGDVRLRSRGAQTKGGDWRGVKSGRNMFPFLRENPDINPSAIEKALRNKDSAAYSRLIEKAVEFNRRTNPNPEDYAYNFIKALGENPDAEPVEETAAAPAPEETKPIIPAIGKGQAGILPGLEEHVARQQAGAAKVAGENLTAEANKPKDISEAAGRIETRGPLFRGTEASPQREIFGKVPTTKQIVPPDIEPVLKESGWTYEGKNNLGQHELREPGTNIKLNLFDRDMTPDFVRRKIAEKEKQYGTPKKKGGEEVPF